MRLSHLPSLALIVLVSACHQRAAQGSEPLVKGRFAGVGIYDAGPLWNKIQGAPQATDSQSAEVGDDEHVIVVLDSHTGEIRQCGDHSGYCVSMSPWAAGRQVPGLPSKLAAHGRNTQSDETPSAPSSAAK